MLKKILSLSVAMLMVFSIASCSAAPTPSSKAASEPLENSEPEESKADPRLGGLTLPLTDTPTKIQWVVTSATTDLSNKWFAQKVKELTNVEIEFVILTQASIKEKVPNLIASKKLPDILGAGLEYPLCNEVGMQGGFAAVNDYLDIMPNYKAKVAESSDYSYALKSFAAGDGKLYGVCPLKISRDVNHGMLYRKDVFDANNLKMWTNTEEFYQVLKKLKEIYPNSTPFVSKGKHNIFKDFSISWGVNGFDMFFDEQSSKWALSSTDARYKEMLDFVKKCYDEKLFDPEFLTATPEQWESKMTQKDQAFVTWDWINRLDMFKIQTAETVPEYDLRYAYPVGPTGQVLHLPDFVGWINSVAKGPNTELCFKLIDFMYSDYGVELATMGVEGETYNITSDGKVSYIGFEDQVAPDILSLEDKYGLFQQSTTKGFDRRSSYYIFSDALQEAQDIIVNEDRIAPLDPILAYSEEDSKTRTKLLPDLMKKGEEFSFKYIFAKDKAECDKLWEGWLKTAKQYGEDELVELYNRTQKEMNG